MGMSSVGVAEGVGVSVIVGARVMTVAGGSVPNSVGGGVSVGDETVGTALVADGGTNSVGSKAPSVAVGAFSVVADGATVTCGVGNPGTLRCKM